MCAPSYAVLLNARSNQETVRVALCFECYTIGVYNTAHDDVRGVNKESDLVAPASATLANLIKELFPEDLAIQGLK
jgi:hypothetical protein